MESILIFQFMKLTVRNLFGQTLIQQKVIM